ncbi:MAG: TlpA family protein disulfide reductase [candidate division WOR-3 bacterium]|nr:TlpA family protein disulfide reductase [candidate division WOR-3 bacterium]MCX7947181.1 TlpA family protein disulfide reductase [candidate division WOR-3 bacterium]MDW8150237.1 TlpA disulfide reductase family protein [candidate division WOR-3 bacterium]
MRLFFILSTLIISIVFFWSLYQASKVRVEKNLKIDRKAIDFKLPRLENLNDSIKLSDFMNKIVILNFWSSWCEPCKEEVNELNRIYEYSGDSVVLIGINIWDRRESALDFIKNYNVKFLNLYAKGVSVSVDYGIRGVPETIVIKEGYIKFHFRGPITFDLIVNSIKQFQQNP